MSTFFYGTITQKKVIHRGSFQFQLISEYWSNDERIDVFFFNTPVLHHSNAETFKNCWQPLNYLFIGYNSEKI